MASAQDCTIILFDVGANTNEYDKVKGKTFFEEAKGCIESIITRKIFTKPKDEISLFLIGTKSSDNEMDYENISHAIAMRPMSWDILNYVQKSIDPPSDDTTGDWLAGIIVAMNEFHQLNLKKGTKKILLFTTFTTDVIDAVKDKVITGLKNEGIDLIVVSKNIIYELNENSQDEYATFSQAVDKNKAQQKSENLIKEIVMETNSVLVSLDEAVAKLIYVDKKSRRRMPWNADLTIGSTFAIKISAYIYVRDEPELATWKSRFVNRVPKPEGETAGLGPSIEISQVSMKTERYHNDEVMDAESVVENLITGYMYGGEAVPFEDAKFESGAKGLKCIGLTSVTNIREKHLTGESIWKLVPQKNMPSSTKRLAALIQAMKNLNLAMIARYVFRENTAPKLMALFASEDSLSLEMYELYFKDNHVSLEFPRLCSKATTPNDDQLNFMDNLIDSMDLTNENTKMDIDEPDQSSEYFKKLIDPGVQYQYRAIAHRAINPGEPLLKVDKEVMNLITAPKQVDVEGLKAHFPLKAAKLTSKETFLKNMQKIGKEEPADANGAAEIKPDYSDIHEIGTVKPADDFLKLLERGEPFNMLTGQIQNVIWSLVVKSLVAMDEKILQAVLAYRETAKGKAPYKYNEWMATFKDLLKEREKVQLWQSLVNESLGLITKEESEMSTVSEEEAKVFAKLDDFNTTQVQTNDKDFTNSNDDMFDDM